MNCWEILGLEPTNEIRLIKRAYVKLLKNNNPEDDAKAFQLVRDAYELALNYAKYLDDNPPEAPELRNNAIENVDDARRHDKPSTQQENPIADALDKIIPLIEEDADRAIVVLEKELENPLFFAYDHRFCFEGELLVKLCSLEFVPFKFLVLLNKIFEWDIDIHRRPFIVDDHLQQNDLYYQAFRQIVGGFIVGAIRRNIVDNYVLGKRFRSEGKAEIVDRAERLLFGEHDETALRVFLRDRRYQELAANIFRYTHAMTFDETGISPIPLKTREWLHKNVFGEGDPKSESRVESYKKARNDASNSDGFRMPGWAWFFIVFFIIKMAMYTTKAIEGNRYEYENNSVTSTLRERPNPKPPTIREYEKLSQAYGASSEEEIGSKEEEYRKLQAFIKASKELTESRKPVPKKWTGKKVFEHVGVYQGELYGQEMHGQGTIHYDDGDSFAGRFEMGERMEGLYTWSNGNTFKGKFVNDRVGDIGLWTFSNGDSFEGRSEKGRPVEGIYRFNNGEIYFGKVVDGRTSEDGFWIRPDGGKVEIISVNGDSVTIKKVWASGKIYEGETLRGLEHGDGLLTELDGSTYKGQFSKGRWVSGTYTNSHGETFNGEVSSKINRRVGTFFYKNGDKFVGTEIDGLRTVGKYTFGSSDVVYEGEMLNGNFDGKATLLDNGKVYQGSFKNALLEGEGSLIDEQGVVYLGRFKSGKRYGKFTVIYPNGQKFSTRFKADKRIRKLKKMRS